ncbi:hypothetical protein [Pelagicoccus mobilis]|uniref:Uncharacterized protein n=1 Tax=Pelagicoccus mobilis TaxID=415221 RepID=A0A934S0X2_9BACT|nr:hypothetical protein [Pelagicoccus mobilis]MBK1878969.1 hypothetical protein [Pelagicoccus mobilis]
MNKHWSLASESNRKKRTKSLWFYSLATPIAVYLGITNFGTESIPPDQLWILAIPALILLFFALILRNTAKGEEKTEIELDYDTGLAFFRNYRFITKFAGDKVLDEVAVPFSGIYTSKITKGKGNSVWLDLVTNRGKVSIGSYVELPEIIEAFDEIIRLNRETNETFDEDYLAAPRPRTPWYGWLILLAGVLAIAFIGWAHLRNT